MQSPEQILEILDEAARTFELPSFTAEQYTVMDSRLHVLRSDSAWALLIEELVYWPEQGGFQGDVAGCGTAFPSAQRILKRWRPIEPSGVEVDDDIEPVGPAAVRIGGEAVSIDWVACASTAAEHATATELEAFARICATRRDALFLPAPALVRLAGGLPRLLVVDDWRHPDLRTGETPSQLDGFRSLAAVIARGDASAYAADAEPNNRDWRHWFRLSE